MKVRTDELMCSAVLSTEMQGGWRSRALLLTLITMSHRLAQGSEPVCQACMSSNTGKAGFMGPSGEMNRGPLGIARPSSRHDQGTPARSGLLCLYPDVSVHRPSRAP